MRYQRVLFFALLLLWGCQSVQQSELQESISRDSTAQMGALENRIVVLVQQERQKLNPNAEPLVLDPELSMVARARAADMAAKDYLAHLGPDGVTSASMLMKQDAKWQGLLGENLAAQHYNSQKGLVVDEFAQRFLDEWVKSPAHRDNLTYAPYDRAGVGAAVNSDTIYVALLLSTELGRANAQTKRPGLSAPAK